MRINVNISALIANSHLQANDNKMSRSMERLSSGLKLNHSADDSAGMAIASKMRTQIKGLSQANRNASDGESIVQTAEGALNEVEAMLQRMRELAVQGANGTNSDGDREAITEEIKALEEEIERISRDTEFNKKPLLDGTLERRRYTNVTGVRVTSLTEDVDAGHYQIAVNNLATQATGTIKFGGKADSDVVGVQGVLEINEYDVIIDADDTIAAVKSKILEASEKLNLTVSEGTASDELILTTEQYGREAEVKCLYSSDELGTALGLSWTDRQIESRGNDMDAEIAAGKGTSGNQFTNTAVLLSNGNKAVIRDNGGFEMEFTIYADELKTKPDGTAANKVTVTAEVKDIGMMTLHVGANEGQIVDVNIPEISLESLGIDQMNTLTQHGCGKALTMLDEAINMVSAVRSSLGAYQNRLDATINNLSVSEESMTAAISRIEDVDMAAEMTEYTKLQVMTQAATSMVAQANERPQTVLQLLQ